MKRALITGGTGFIGRWCVKALIERGWHVCVLSSRPSTAPNHPQITYIQSNILNPSEHKQAIQKAQASHLLHLSWCVEHHSFKTSLENIDWLAASIHFVKEFYQKGGRRVVNAGSCMEYDWSFSLLSETTPCHPNTLYGICKHQLFSTLSQIKESLNLSYASGRIFFVYGPFEKSPRFLSSIVLSLLHSKEARCMSANICRDFLHVRDVADALVTILLSEIEGPVNIGSGEATALGEIASYIGEKLQVSHLICNSFAKPTPRHPLAFAADITRLSSELLWKPHLSLWKGIDDTISWWQANMAHT